ncbi:MAG TPA: hypothetical protein VFH73_12005, partial [Polyangia bacterium]|nr:hypothetical protein [Polyangia bacterium]
MTDEVEKARTFPERLGEFAILTTAKKSTQAQQRVRQINKEHAAKGLFIVRLFTWDDIERILDECPGGQECLGVQSPRALRRLLRAEVQPLHDGLRTQSDDLHGAELDEVKKQIGDGNLQLGALLLGRIRAKAWDRLSPRNRYRFCTFSADVEMRQGNEPRAAQLLLEAKTYQPNDDNAASNEIVAYELLGNLAKAFETASSSMSAHPHSAPIYAGALRTASSHSEFNRLFETRPDHFRDDPEIWLAAAGRQDIPPEKAEAISAR